MQIEFTDRYGGNPPSWLRGCFDCEAMGCMPVDSKISPEWVKSYLSNHPECEGPDELGYIFAICPYCNGAGRVSWLATVQRIPRWIWKGITFPGEVGLNWEMKAPWMTKMEHFVMCLKCAFLVDLGLWKP